jgi:hypothetical protein
MNATKSPAIRTRNATPSTPALVGSVVWTQHSGPRLVVDWIGGSYLLVNVVPSWEDDGTEEGRTTYRVDHKAQTAVQDWILLGMVEGGQAQVGSAKELGL